MGTVGCYLVVLAAVTTLCVRTVVQGAPGPPSTCSICAPNECGLVEPRFKYTCPNGNILDSCGCVRSCQCAGCPRFNSELSCPNGKETDRNGCPLSKCKPCPLCPSNDCGLLSAEFAFSCPNGNILNYCGCVKSCQCAGCPPFRFDLSCPGGKKTDAKGCPLDECKPVCEFAGNCAAVTCLAAYGNAADGNGCPLRGCPCQAAANCPAVDGCTLDCSSRGGYRRVNGCVTCACAQKAGTCPQYGAWGRRPCTNDYVCDGNTKCCNVPYVGWRCQGSFY